MCMPWERIQRLGNDSDHEVHLSAHPYGRGRGVYLAGLPYSHENTRLLIRSMYYAACKEGEMKKWFSDNLFCEVHGYPEAGKYAVVNNTSRGSPRWFMTGMDMGHPWSCCL